MKEWVIPALAIFAWGTLPGSHNVARSVLVVKEDGSEKDAKESNARSEPNYPETVFKSLREFLVLEFPSESDRGRFSIRADETEGEIEIRLSRAFADGSAEVNDPIPKTIARLLRLAQASKTQSPRRVDLEIYADTHEADTQASLWQLTLARSQTLWRSLQEASVDLHLLSVSARGGETVVAAETDEASQALNRRVEIIIRY